MFVSSYHKGNPQPDKIKNPDGPKVEYEVDFLGIPKESRGETDKEKMYWIGKVYNVNASRGRRKTTKLWKQIQKHFGVSERTIWKYSKFAEACDMLSEDGDGSKVANASGPQTRTIDKAKAEKCIFGDWVLKPYVLKPWTIPWKFFGGERAYAAKEMALRGYSEEVIAEVVETVREAPERDPVAQ